MTELIFQKGDIIIDRHLARFGSVSFPINNIGSVVVLNIGLALLASSRSKTALLLRTSSGGQQALLDKNHSLVNQIKAAIESAIVSRT